MPFLEMARSGGALWKMLDINAFLHKRAISSYGALCQILPELLRSYIP